MSPYGELVLTHTLPTVVQAPTRTLLTVEALRTLNSVYLLKPDVICVGEDDEGNPVVYAIVGWSAPERALILARRSDELMPTGGGL
jgi:hypothetical protein